MKNLTFCLLAFGIIILSAKLSVTEASTETETRPAEHKPALVRFVETIWKIILSPFMLFFTALDYATELGERSGAYLQKRYESYRANPVTVVPETNEIPPFVKSVPLPENTGEKKENILHRINAWVKSKTAVFKKSHKNESVAITPNTKNTTDWQYPSDLSEDSGQETVSNGLNWFLSPRKLILNEPGKVENQTEKILDDLLSTNVTHRRRSKILSAAGKELGRARDAIVEKAHNLGARGRLAYDWVIWKLLARHSTLPTFFGRANSTDGRKTWMNQPDNPNLTSDPMSNSTLSFSCDEEPRPVCAVDNYIGFTIFQNPCKLSLFNYQHNTNFTIYSTDVCMGLFIKYPEKFYQSKKE